MKKILFYDCFTKGVGPVISPINNILPKDKFQTKLLHFESIYDFRFPKYIKKEGLDCYDFSYYQTYNIKKILKEEKPDLVIFFDKRGLTDRAGVLAAKALNIKTLQIQHGSEAPLSLDRNSDYFKNTFGLNFYLGNLRRIAISFFTYFITVVSCEPFYFLNPKKWLYLFWLFVNPRKHYFLYADETKCQKVLIFGEHDRAHYKKIEGYDNSEIIVIGNLYLDAAAGLSDKEEEKKMPLKRALLISSPVIEDKVFGWTEEVRKKFLINIFRFLKEKKVGLTIKIHPRERLVDYENIFKYIQDKPKITKDENLDKLILTSDFVIGTYSTALMNAVFLKRPLIIADWLKVKYSEYYYQWKVARLAKDLPDFRKIIEDLEKGIFIKDYETNRNRFIKYFSYKDDGLARKRIVENISNLLISF